MTERRRSAVKPQRDGKRQAKGEARGKAAKSAEPEPVFYPHALFGQIPMLPVTHVLADGSLHHGRDYDPDYAPPLPKGAVRGDVRQQEFCRMCHAPKYFYVDVPRTCVECGAAFVFAAKEQKHWFEVLKFHFDSIPIRCVGCRRKRRSDKALGLEVASAKQRLREEPASPSAHLAVAEALVRLRLRSGQGQLSEALAAARKARRLLKEHAKSELGESYYWEAACQALAGRPVLARELYERFVASPGGGKRRRELEQVAKAWRP